MMWAAAQSQTAMIRLLLEYGAKVNARGAIRDWQTRITAEPRPKDRHRGGFTPLLYAARLTPAMPLRVAHAMGRQRQAKSREPETCQQRGRAGLGVLVVATAAGAERACRVHCQYAIATPSANRPAKGGNSTQARRKLNIATTASMRRYMIAVATMMPAAISAAAAPAARCRRARATVVAVEE